MQCCGFVSYVAECQLLHYCKADVLESNARLTNLLHAWYILDTISHYKFSFDVKHPRKSGSLVVYRLQRQYMRLSVSVRRIPSRKNHQCCHCWHWDIFTSVPSAAANSSSAWSLWTMIASVEHCRWSIPNQCSPSNNVFFQRTRYSSTKLSHDKLYLQ